MAKRQIPPAPAAFGEALRAIRSDKGLSQEEVALESELDRSYISLIESGKKQPTITTIVSLASALGVKPSEIIKNMESLLK